MSSDRVWVVTGSNSGLGLAMAQHMLSRGDKVIATVRSMSKFPDTLKQAGARPLILDLGSFSDEKIQEVAKEALQIYGHVDVLVNNAKRSFFHLWKKPRGCFAALSLLRAAPHVLVIRMKDVREQFQVNLFSRLAFSQPFITHFRTRRAGHILNISSNGSISPAPTWGAYCATKAAMDALTDVLSTELRLYNVRVLSVLAGYFDSNIWGVEGVPHQDKPQSTVYTDPSQGYDAISALPRLRYGAKQVGDPLKMAACLYDVVTGTGLAERLVPSNGGKYEWTRVPLGIDSGEIVLDRLEVMLENMKVFEPIWRAANMDDVKMEQLAEVNGFTS